MTSPHALIHHMALVPAAIVSLLTQFLSAQSKEIVYQPNRANEAITKDFSADRAISFIEDSVSRWQANRKCITCHTNGLHLIAASQATPSSKVFLENQRFAREYVTDYVSGKKTPTRQHGAIEGLVATSSFLAISEMTTGKKLHPMTAAALDHVWRKQSPSGAWDNWLKCNWGPFEVDDHYGVTLATIALSMTPPEYQKTKGALGAKVKLTQFLRKNPPASLHQKGMLLWASKYDSKLVSPRQINGWIKELKSLQQKDGGWALIQLGNQDWKRTDGKAHHRMSDGYATAFSIFVLRQSGVETSDPVIQSGLRWLKSNQRESGRWFTHSPRRDGKNYITQAATNMALLALATCDELPAR